MTQLKPGDEVVCRIKDYKIVSSKSECDKEETFEIIAVDDGGYFVYVPVRYALHNTIEISTPRLKLLRIDKKYLGEQSYYITQEEIVRIKSVLDGCSCARCGEFFPMAQPNQADGSMRCFLCRTYKYR
jgi:hypothetical protein